MTDRTRERDETNVYECGFLWKPEGKARVLYVYQRLFLRVSRCRFPESLLYAYPVFRNKKYTRYWFEHFYFDRKQVCGSILQLCTLISLEKYKLDGLRP